MGNTELRGLNKSKKGGISFGTSTNLSKNDIPNRISSVKLGSNSKSVTKISDINKKLSPPSPKDSSSSNEQLNINKFKVKKNTKIEKSDFKLLNSSLTNHYLFHYVDNETIKKTINKLIKCQAQKNEIIYEKDSNEGEYFYILIKGKMHYNADVSDKIKEFQDLSINPGNCFGDYEIINGIYRLCNVVTDEECIFYALDKNDLLDLLKNVRKKKSFKY